MKKAFGNSSIKTSQKQVIVQARLRSTGKLHAFGEGDTSLCGRAHINDCHKIKLAMVSTRLMLYIWPRWYEDLNYCGACRRSLKAKGIVV